MGAENTITMTEHYRLYAEHRAGENNVTQAALFTAWKALAQQQKGLRRLSRKVKSLKMQLAQQGKR